MEHLCMQLVDQDERCHQLLRRYGGNTWQCPAGHIWYGSNPSVLKSTPWRPRSRRIHVVHRAGWKDTHPGGSGWRGRFGRWWVWIGPYVIGNTRRF